MKLTKILKNINYELIQGDINIDINEIVYDSRKCTKDSAFVALKGIDTDGHKYIPSAIDLGCKCIFVCENIKDICEDITIIKLSDTRRELAYLAENFFNHPGNDLIKIAITGTKGKTTTSYMIKSILEASGEKVGIIGTIGTVIDNKLYEHKNTTPESYEVQKYMRMMVDAKVKYLVMEVSSQALKVGRVSNIYYDYSIFTNLSIDHIGEREHKDFNDYSNSKALLFKQSKIGIINKDDKYYNIMTDNCSCKVYSYGSKNCDLNLVDTKYYADDDLLGISINTSGLVNNEFLVSAPGLFSAYNAMSSILLCNLLGISDEIIKDGLKKFKVKGRCEVFNLPRGIKVIIDYAHNKISMESIIKTMKEYKTGRVVTVFGCGGGRSSDRRFELGEMSGKYADFSIITMDNPRNDDIDDINKDISSGIESVNGDYIIINDRVLAIRYAIENAKDNDIILLLGKGHEKFQQVKDKIYDLDEEKVVSEYIR